MPESDQDFLERRDEFDDRRPPRKEGLSGCAIAAIGCGVVLVILLIVGGLGIWWVANNARTFGAEIAAEVLKASLQELDLPADQQVRIDARIDDIAQQFKDEKLTGEDVGRIFQRIAEGPLMPAGLALFVKRVYIRDSGLSDDEKVAAEIAIHRFARGVTSTSPFRKPNVEAVLRHHRLENAGPARIQAELTGIIKVRAFVNAVAKQQLTMLASRRVVLRSTLLTSLTKLTIKALGETAKPAAAPDVIEPASAT